jgi:dihydrolipoamide dehydrogenase-binding protein of pyruvate dehydrogenase complex
MGLSECSEYANRLFSHQVKEDAKDVKVGTVIALMVNSGEDWKTVEIPSAAVPSAPSPPSTVAKPSVAVPSTSE